MCSDTYPTPNSAKTELRVRCMHNPSDLPLHIVCIVMASERLFALELTNFLSKSKGAFASTIHLSFCRLDLQGSLQLCARHKGVLITCSWRSIPWSIELLAGVASGIGAEWSVLVWLIVGRCGIQDLELFFDFALLVIFLNGGYSQDKKKKTAFLFYVLSQLLVLSISL